MSRELGFADKANGSELKVNGKVVGSKLLGQTFTKAKYFHGRPSSAGAAAAGTDAADPNDENKTVPNDPKDLSQDISSGSNYGPTNPDFLDIGEAAGRRLPQGERSREGRAGAGGCGDGVGFGSRSAHLGGRMPGSRPRGVARVRGVPLARVNKLIDEHTDGRSLGFLGEKGVNVLELNVALDATT